MVFDNISGRKKPYIVARALPILLGVEERVMSDASCHWASFTAQGLEVSSIHVNSDGDG
jgi:hypothetical protein